MKKNVVTEVVDHELCIGCGLCAALCPEEALEMAWNRYGEYNPAEVEPCTRGCGLCLKVCPFADHEEDEDTIGEALYGSVPGIGHRSEVGYHLATFVGYADEHRSAGASGGMATWLLERLLAEVIVDHVVCVAPTGDPEGLFSFFVFDDPEGVRTGAGSAYYPVEMSGVVRHILDTPGSYAVTGLPCFIKAIRLAQKKNPKLRERVVVTVGLVCGQMKSRPFTEYIASLACLLGKVKEVRYRGKSPDHPATNYHYAFTSTAEDERRIFWNDGIAEAWTNRWFTPKACNYCDDVFAEVADVTFMDAWLPDYSRDYRGTNLVVVRSPLIEDLIRRGVQDGGILAEPVPVEDVIRSQAEVVDVKRRHLAHRLYLDLEMGREVLRKRVRPAREKSPLLRREIALKDRMRGSSRAFWAESEDQDAGRLREAMGPDLKRLSRGRTTAWIMALPIRIVIYVQGHLRGNHHE